MSPPPCRRPRPTSLRRALLPLLVGAILLPQAGCGKKGPPLPPLRRGPDRVTDVSARQVGRRVIVTGLLPDRNQDGGPLAPLQEVRIFRLDGAVTADAGMLPAAKSAQRAALRQFSKEARSIATLSGEDLGKALSGRRLTYQDPEPAAGPVAEGDRELTYAMTAVDVEKRSSPLSPLARIRLRTSPLPPSNLRAEFSEKRIRLAWEPPASQGAAEPPRYNLYRSEEEGRFPDRPRNDRPLSQPFFEEEDFGFGRTYYYMVRSVIGEKASERESEDSFPLKVAPQDVYAPSVPTGLAVSAEDGVFKLYWFPNNEPDLGGYRIYRSEKETEDFQVIATAGAEETTYVDRAVQPGVRYYYCLTAVDRADPPNESGRSEVHGDRLPPLSGAAAPGTPRHP